MKRTSADEWLDPLRKRNLLPDEVLAAFVVGSAARGWHNARSDYDIYIVTTSQRDPGKGDHIPIPLDPPFLMSEIFYAQNKRWEIKYWLDSQVDQMLDKVSWEAYERGTSAGGVLTLAEELMFSRLSNCLPLIGEEWVHERRRQLAKSAFRSFLLVRSLGAVDDAVEDALGQMEAGHLECAAISARNAFGHAIDALLESEGEFGSHQPKWRPNRFKAAAPAAVSFETYWALETMQTYDPVDPRPWIKSILTFCQDIAMGVEVS
ncbi:nucleotidyltransferase domain-containing protein [Micromonospora sp. C51]|uniref:nucleotidyltransferase domain-containing protein n=1 Tax=Micromonospora sp. C51 TaxID=2824879 RepID=UPI001B37B405|nr:nucleotidyltransferase domain-containing protein [Micromonospora sp. C51]MBQ1050204.1 nucleotidyltransferase domain-containing protein [Micromonospora sp. C51]